ncbi:hypothetical protein Q5P01_017558 [Channa striata]|uniref:Scaffolding anchor of CK1 domain-containing protein n=1 Tax=Channa striata TaxID=64152 RepID=A0AA88MB23_CHASR|nr:hypothetical protein Q5P01_017558 [Channa striata]
MALSQIQCLDENHVNPRTHESKPDFFYCEEQRLALEALLRDGREAFAKHLDARGLRGFLSDPELETLLGAVEPYDPGSELFPANGDDDEPPLSLHYWPELSDTSVPQLDLGWPDSESYRGVTRTTVYAQPPLEGQAHVKEVVRKMIAQAQKMVAVVMDVFTDVDIFRDLLDAGFKRRVAVYILLERTTLPHFMSMCQRANMHAGHLKHLRVRCTDGAEFYTRSCTKVKGRMGHRFMFIDGDKAVSGSYSFSWMSSRLDRNLITVVTGQAVDAFDRLFRHLYVCSSSVDLRQIATEPEPEPEPLPQPAAVVPPSAAVARKLYNPKYALVTLGNPSQTSTPSADPSNSKGPQNLENSKNPDVPETNKGKKKRPSKEAIEEAMPLHPGLTDLEKACLISYLPTWPEPDPPSDVIGFINIRDSSKPTQVHLQRSEMFETSQAIRFSSPLSRPKETLPEVAKPRQLTAKCVGVDKLQPIEGKTKAVDSVQSTSLTSQPDNVTCKKEAYEPEPPSSGQTNEPPEDTTENKPHSGTPPIQDACSNTTPQLNAHTPPQSSSQASTPTSHGSSDSTQTVTSDSPNPESLPELNTQNTAETTLNVQSLVHGTHTLESNNTQSPCTEPCTQERTGLPCTNSHTQEQNSSEMNPAEHNHISTSSASDMNSQAVGSASVSENNHIPNTTSATTDASAPLSSTVSSTSLPPLTTSTTMLDHPLPSSTTPSPLTPVPPIPKPRTIHLVIKDKGTSENLTEIIVDRTESSASTGQLVHSNPEEAIMVQTPPEQEPETSPEVHPSKMGAQEDTEKTGSPVEAPQQKQVVLSQETKAEEAVGLDDTAAETQAQSAVLISEAPNAGSVHIREITTKDINLSTDCEITSKTQADQTATILTDCQLPEKPRHEAQRTSQCQTNPPGNGACVNCVNALTHAQVCATANSHTSNDSVDDGTNCPQHNPSATAAPHADSKPNTAKHNTDINAASQEFQPTFTPRGSSHTPERPLRLHLSDTPIRDLRSLAAPVRTPTPDGLPPDSRTHTPDPRLFSQDLRSPTSDVSDGYVSPRDDSTVSTTSEEYYECCECPFHGPVVDTSGSVKNGLTENHVDFTHTHSPNSTSVSSTTLVSPADVNHNTHPAGKNSFCSETQNLSEPVRVSPSEFEKKVITGGEQGSASEEDEKGKNVTEQGSQGTEGRGNKEAKKTAEHLTQVEGTDLTEVVEQDKGPQPRAPKKKRPLNQSASETLVDGGNSSKEATDPKRPSTGSVKAENGERSDTEKVVDKAALKPSGMEKRDWPQPTRDTDGQKDSESSPSRPPRPFSAAQLLGTRPWGYHHLNQTESKDLHGNIRVSSNTSSPRRPSSRPPPPLALGAIASAAVQKQTKVFHGQQQPTAAPGRARVRQPSLLFTHSNIQPHPHSQNPSVSPQEARRQDEARAPFTITFGRLYSLKGLRDKVSKQSKRGGASSPAHRSKSTS